MRKRLLFSFAVLILFISSIVFFVFYKQEFTHGVDNKDLVGCASCNIILVSFDALRPDHLGCYGYPRNTSPNIDRLASRSVVFDNAVTVMPLTGPSTTSFLTGLYPSRHKVVNNQIVLQNNTSLVQILRENGFVTAAFVGSSILRPTDHGLNKLFDFFSFDPNTAELNRPEMVERDAGDTTESVINWLRGNRDKRFFVWIHYIEPHGPYTHPVGYLGRFSHNASMFVDAAKIPAYQRLPDAPILINSSMNLTDALYYVDRYDEEIVFADSQFGVLLAALDSLNLSGKTILVVTSDHGESLTEHDDYFYHSRTSYEENLRVPIVIAIPPRMGVRPKRVNSLASTMDILPTCLDIVGLSPEASIDGVSLLPSITDDVSVRDDVFIQNFTVRFVKSKVINDRCFDLERDPLETGSIPCDNSTMQKLQERLGYYRSIFEYEEGSYGNLSAEELSILRSLGYVQ